MQEPRTGRTRRLYYQDRREPGGLLYIPTHTKCIRQREADCQACPDRMERIEPVRHLAEIVIPRSRPVRAT